MRGSRMTTSNIFTKSRQNSMKKTRDSCLFPLSPAVALTNNSSNCENMVGRKTQEIAQLEFAVCLFFPHNTYLLSFCKGYSTPLESKQKGIR